MRTRSGRDVGNREAGRTDDMADDNHSTEARWGTPAHTARYDNLLQDGVEISSLTYLLIADPAT